LQNRKEGGTGLIWVVLIPVGWGRRWKKGVGDEYSANTVYMSI
jgi:hypothetical protein